MSEALGGIGSAARSGVPVREDHGDLRKSADRSLEVELHALRLRQTRAGNAPHLHDDVLSSRVGVNSWQAQEEQQGTERTAMWRQRSSAPVLRIAAPSFAGR